MMDAFEDFDLTDRQRVDKRILHWGGTTRLFQIGMTIEKPCVRSYSRCARVATDQWPFACRCRRFLRGGQDAVKVRPTTVSVLHSRLA